MKKRVRRCRSGFTLTEMLVVIAIIGILMAIVIPTLMTARVSVQEAAIKFEIEQIKQALEVYKQEHGVYPPDFTAPAFVAARVGAHLKKLSRNYDSANVTAFLTNIDSDSNLANGVQSVITPDEALVFWLSRTVNNPEVPLPAVSPGHILSDPIGNERVYFEFDEARLVDPDNDGFFSYVPKHAKKAPYVYFDHRTYDVTGADPSSGFNPVAAGFSEAKGIARPYYSDVTSYNSEVASPPPHLYPWEITKWHWHGEDSFQIISAGMDENYGVDVYDNFAWSTTTPAPTTRTLVPKVYPNKSSILYAADGSLLPVLPADYRGPGFTGSDRDNFTSFADKRLDSELEF